MTNLRQRHKCLKKI